MNFLRYKNSAKDVCQYPKLKRVSYLFIVIKVARRVIFTIFDFLNSSTFVSCTVMIPVDFYLPLKENTNLSQN